MLRKQILGLAQVSVTINPPYRPYRHMAKVFLHPNEGRSRYADLLDDFIEVYSQEHFEEYSEEDYEEYSEEYSKEYSDGYSEEFSEEYSEEYSEENSLNEGGNKKHYFSE